MPTANRAALEFLLSRRSRPAKTLTTPVPSDDELAPILTAAARTPDHGKLEPWRFIVLQGDALDRLAALAHVRGDTLGKDHEQTQKGIAQFADSNLAIAVISSPKPTEKFPVVEQTYSAGAVCLSLLNAALASGWGANWLSGWVSHDAVFCSQGLGLQSHETVAGFIHLGTEKNAPPERPRPDISAITTWMSN